MAEEFRAKGLEVTIIRPKSFVGPERLGVFAMFYEWAADGHNFPMTGPGTNRYQLLDVEDLCDAIYLTLTLPAEIAKRHVQHRRQRVPYHAGRLSGGDGQSRVWQESPILPAEPVIWGLRALEFFHLSPLYKWIYETLTKTVSCRSRRPRRGSAGNPRFSNADALLRNYEWYLANRHLLGNQSGVSHRVPWSQGALKILKAFF